MIRFTYDGKEFEFRGVYDIPKMDQYYITNTGGVEQHRKYEMSDLRAIVHPDLVIHEFGGVKFVETGEERTARSGEWCMYRSEEGVQFRGKETFSIAIILKPYLE